VVVTRIVQVPAVTVQVRNQQVEVTRQVVVTAPPQQVAVTRIAVVEVTRQVTQLVVVTATPAPSATASMPPVIPLVCNPPAGGTCLYLPVVLR
jgi:hypothetical protein